MNYLVIAAWLGVTLVAMESAKANYDGAYIKADMMRGTIEWLERLVVLPSSSLLMIAIVLYFLSMKITELLFKNMNHT